MKKCLFLFSVITGLSVFAVSGQEKTITAVGPSTAKGNPAGAAANAAPPVYTYVEQMPQADYDWGAYLAKNMRYPSEAVAQHIEGRVIVKFVVNEDGTISDAVVLRGIGGGCDEEAKRVIMAAPKWKAG